jgi:hypothetical protein
VAKICALCARSTSPKNGVTNTPDAVLCHLCITQYEASPEFQREQYFTKVGNELAARRALVDFVNETMKTRQVQDEITKQRESAEKAAKEKAEAEKAPTKKVEPAAVAAAPVARA